MLLEGGSWKYVGVSRVPDGRTKSTTACESHVKGIECLAIQDSKAAGRYGQVQAMHGQER